MGPRLNGARPSSDSKFDAAPTPVLVLALTLAPVPATATARAAVRGVTLAALDLASAAPGEGEEGCGLPGRVGE